MREGVWTKKVKDEIGRRDYSSMTLKVRRSSRAGGHDKSFRDGFGEGEQRDGRGGSRPTKKGKERGYMTCQGCWGIRRVGGSGLQVQTRTRSDEQRISGVTCHRGQQVKEEK